MGCEERASEAKERRAGLQVRVMIYASRIGLLIICASMIIWAPTASAPSPFTPHQTSSAPPKSERQRAYLPSPP